MRIIKANTPGDELIDVIGPKGSRICSGRYRSGRG